MPERTAGCGPVYVCVCERKSAPSDLGRILEGLDLGRKGRLNGLLFGVCLRENGTFKPVPPLQVSFSLCPHLSSFKVLFHHQTVASIIDV